MGFHRNCKGKENIKASQGQHRRPPWKKSKQHAEADCNSLTAFSLMENGKGMAKHRRSQHSRK